MNEDLINRITYYLSSGGLFNPELADHLAVRNLLMECKEALAQRSFDYKEHAEGLQRDYDLLLAEYNDLKAQRTWVGLTTDEFKFIASKYLLSREAGLEYFQEEIEAKLKEKNT